ncbi:hypothetical protein U9M48_044474 [Paspalum notatum var. saurae]|uniref:Uncharacterized protein n=1 Tax=Paspalum notatum var. saurae TaxID=547442 RepID=A0AAQ3UZ92_PASNO
MFHRLRRRRRPLLVVLDGGRTGSASGHPRHPTAIALTLAGVSTAVLIGVAAYFAVRAVRRRWRARSKAEPTAAPPSQELATVVVPVVEETTNPTRVSLPLPLPRPDVPAVRARRRSPPGLHVPAAARPDLAPSPPIPSAPPIPPLRFRPPLRDPSPPRARDDVVDDVDRVAALLLG